MKVERKIEYYIAQSIKKHKLTEERINDLKKNATNEAKEHGVIFNDIWIANTINEVKKSELRQQYFKLHPNDLLLFTNPNLYNKDSNAVMQICTDGGFETWPVTGNPFVFRRAVAPTIAVSGLGPNINTSTTQFTAFAVGTGTNNFNASATLVTPGNDPIVPAVSRVLAGNKAIKLNFTQNTSSAYTYNVVSMSRNFVINENFFDFNYSVILNDPGNGHALNEKPFFLIRIYDNANNILRNINVLTNPSDCSLQSTTNANYNGTILYTGWKCARINTADLMGQNVRVEFIVSDCFYGQHFGTVYIDNICNSNCANPLFGSINLNSIPNILCPTTTQTICGTFQIPFNSQYTSMLLNVTQNGVIKGTIAAPSSINLTNGTYCFTVPLSAFGTNPIGNFEFQVIGNFTRLCTINYQLDPISDNSANDTGPDVTFNPPVTPTFNQVGPVCAGTTLTPLPTTSTNGVTGTWLPTLNNTATTTYTFTPSSGLCATTTTMTITINPKVVPTFTAVAPICKGSTLSALPTTSNNGITGTWSPSLNNMATTTYTFTPTAGLCANTTTLTIVVTPIVAVNDNFITPINTLTGGNTPTVFTNDTLNGVAVTGSTVTTSIVSCTPTITPTPTINAAGVISIPQGTAIGTYSIVYNITQVGCAANFATATATVAVTEQTIVTPTIVPGIRANNIVSLVDTQSDGKIIIVGYFTAYNNITCLNINRLNTDLTYDTNSGFVVTGPTPAMFIPLDMEVIKTPGADYNKILLVGSFTGFSSGTSGNGIVRLNTNGSIDTSFNAAYTGINKGASGLNSQIRTIFVFPTGHPLAGKILIGGMFKAYNNNPANKLALLNADGSFVTGTFNTNINTIINTIPMQAAPGFTSSPQTIGVQSDGKIIIGGYFNWYNGLNKLHIIRLNVDGSHDNTFNSNYTGVNPGVLASPALKNGPYINKLVVQPDDKIIIAGLFTHYNNNSSNNIARLNANGTYDPTFVVGTGFNNNVINTSTDTPGLVRDLILDTGTPSNILLYACGDFTGYQGGAVDEIVRIKCSPAAAGQNDFAGFTLAGGGPNGTNNGTVWSMKRQNDGKIIIGGKFTSYDIFSALNVTRIFPANPSGQAKTSTIYYDSEPEIDLFASSDVIIYPNPTDGILYFKSANMFEDNFSIAIYNTLGQIVFEKLKVNKSETMVNLSVLKSGTYFVTFSNSSKKITKTLVIK